MTSGGSSTLLRSLHYSVPAIARLFRDRVGAVQLPTKISSASDGETVLDIFCHELDMGAMSLRRWRSGLSSAARRRWWASCDGGTPNTLQRCNADDIQFVRSVINDLEAVVSPFLTLSCSTIGDLSRGTSFVATQRILPGVFLLSLPTAAVFFAQPPSANDTLISFFMHVEDLVGQLVAADASVECEGPVPSHSGYISYLKKSVTPCNNLPFLELEEVTQLLANDSTVKGGNDASRDSPAFQLWEYFHRDMEGLPLTAFLRERLSKEEYAWWVSLVLSRRVGSATLIPVVDKLNHSPEPNCYYTMATDKSFCGLDVFDNLLAGVDYGLLYEPYVHLFSIREISPGEELTLCYASPPTTGRQKPEVTGGFSDGGEGISVTLKEGRAAWQLQWGFIPHSDSPYSSSDLLEVASIVAERRVNLRRQFFPHSSNTKE
ncbi:hypothetical protein TRVL_00670 [Trypanosoma vivax]|nr:hypothetical protein TRVL_00670 [Trypanosoma vivax]